MQAAQPGLDFRRTQFADLMFFLLTNENTGKQSDERSRMQQNILIVL
jgi:hypothetical protein